MRCFPSRVCSSPLTTARTNSVAKKKNRATPPKARAAVNSRPASESGWTSRKPTVVTVMAVM